MVRKSDNWKVDIIRKKRVIIKVIIGSLLLLLFIGIATILLSLNTPVGHMYRYEKKASKLMENENYEAALKFYLKASDQTVKTYEYPVLTYKVSKGTADCYYQLGDYQNASIYYEIATIIYEKDVDAYLKAAECYEAMGESSYAETVLKDGYDHIEDERLYQAILELDPDFSLQK